MVVQKFKEFVVEVGKGDMTFDLIPAGNGRKPMV